jgi:hypothetical protein
MGMETCPTSLPPYLLIAVLPFFTIAQRIIGILVAGDTEHTAYVFGLVHLVGGVALLSQTIVSAPPPSPGYHRLSWWTRAALCRTGVDLYLSDQCEWNPIQHLCHHILATVWPYWWHRSAFSNC